MSSKGYNVHRIPYEFSAIHVQLDDNYVARVNTAVHLQEGCIIEVNLESIDEFEGVLGELLRLEDGHAPTDPYELLGKFSTVFSTAIDTIVDNFSTTSSHDVRYLLEIEQPHSANNKVQKTIAQTAFQEPVVVMPERGIPDDSELTTNESGFELLGGLEHPKKRLQEIATYFADPEGAKMYGISPTHFLLHGPSGTGKTSLIHALANETGAELQTITSTKIIDKYIGESPRLLTKIFEDAYARDTRQILFFDEIDVILGDQKTSQNAYVEVKKLLQQLIIETSKYHPEIIICGATNSDTDDIEPALIRSGRLEPIAVPKPTQHERQSVWATVIWNSSRQFCSNEFDAIASDIREWNERGFTPYDENLNCEELAAHSEDMTGSDFEEVLERGRRKCYAIYRATGEQRQVTQADLLEILKNFSAS